MVQSDAVMRRRGGKGLYKPTATALPKSGSKRKAKKIPEYLEASEIGSLIELAPNETARLCMMLQWRAGLRVSEAIKIRPADVSLKASTPEIKVRQGKGKKDRLVPIHPELNRALATFIGFRKLKSIDPLIPNTRQRVWQWYKEALKSCVAIGAIPEGKPCMTHTLRHSAARYWLMNDVPINVVSHWLGHSNLQTTLIYLQLVSDPGGFMERVP